MLPFPLPEVGRFTSHGVGLFATNSIFGFESGDKSYYIDCTPIPDSLKDSYSDDALGVFQLNFASETEGEVYLADGEVFDSEINRNNEDYSYILLGYKGKKYKVVWLSDGSYYVTLEG